MDGLTGFKRIAGFLFAQVILLIACGLYLGYVVLNHSDRPDLAVAASCALLLAAVALLALRAAWPMGSNGVELFWGTSVKVRMERWMQPALSIGSVALAIAAALLVINGGSEWPRRLDGVLAVSAIAVPLGITVYLGVSAWRRMVAYHRGHRHMEAVLAQTPGLERVSISIASQQGKTATTVRPNPQGFTFAGLTSRPWHDPAQFPWVRAFENAVDEITAEFDRVRRGHDGAITAYDYAGLEGKFWQSFQFATRHREIPENLALCPVTARLLRQIPHYPGFRDAMFSILEGGGHIPPHRDVSNVFLTMHLPLITPGNGTIEVGGLPREWRRGEAMIFDSSYQHQARNESDQTRVVLLVDFLHPDLSDQEAAWVMAARL